MREARGDGLGLPGDWEMAINLLVLYNAAQSGATLLLAGSQFQPGFTLKPIVAMKCGAATTRSIKISRITKNHHIAVLASTSLSH
jgi:hypothetical protein